MQRLEQLPHMVAVEMPGRIVNPDRAVAALGGPARTAQALQPQAKLFCQLRPEDPTAHALPMQQLPNTDGGLLLKVRRRRGVAEPQETDIQVTVAGIIDHVFRPDDFVDFQHLPGLPKVGEPLFKRRRPEDSVLHPEFFTAPVARNICPPVFVPHSVRARYDFLPNPQKARVDDKKKRQQAMQEAGDHRERDLGIVDSTAEKVPSAPSETLILQPEHALLVERLKTKFEERAIWNAGVLAETVPEIPRLLLKSLLRHVAYSFSSGPWRTMHVRYGYDPRKDPGAMLFQIFDFRPPQARRVQAKHMSLSRYRDYIDLSRKQSAGASTHIYTRGALPEQRQVLYQLCDLQDDDIQSVLLAQGHRGEYSHAHGWLPNGVKEKIKNIMQRQCEETIRNAEAAASRATQTSAASALSTAASGRSR